MKRKIFTAAVGFTLLSLPIVANNDIRTEQVHFNKGTTGTTVKGSIKGYESVSYKLGAKEGQTMRISLKSKKAFINIYEPGKGPGKEAIFVGSTLGGEYKGVLAMSGTYTISVYLMRNEARRGTNAPYTLQMNID